MKTKDSSNYQSILRAIGQGIENLEVESFDLRVDADHEFVVSGVCKETNWPMAVNLGGKTSLLSLIINAAKSSRAKNPRTRVFRFTGIRFNEDNIERLDQAGKALRTSQDSHPQNPLGVAHVLRMIGAYLDTHHSRFSRLLWEADLVTLWHFNENGFQAKEIFTSENLNDHWIQHFKARTRSRSGLKPTGSD